MMSTVPFLRSCVLCWARTRRSWAPPPPTSCRQRAPIVAPGRTLTGPSRGTRAARRPTAASRLSARPQSSVSRRRGPSSSGCEVTPMCSVGCGRAFRAEDTHWRGLACRAVRQRPGPAVWCRGDREVIRGTGRRPGFLRRSCWVIAPVYTPTVILSEGFDPSEMAGYRIGDHFLRRFGRPRLPERGLFVLRRGRGDRSSHPPVLI